MTTIEEALLASFFEPMKKLTLLFITAALTFVSCKKGEPSEHLSFGEMMPEFSSYTLGGQNVSSTELGGKMSIVVFFDTRCPDCKSELPEIEDIWKHYVNSINLLCIAREEDAAHIESYWDGMGYTMPVVAPGDRKIYNLFDRDSGSGVPQVYIFNAERILIDYYNDNHLLTFLHFSEIYEKELY